MNIGADENDYTVKVGEEVVKIANLHINTISCALPKNYSSQKSEVIKVRIIPIV